MPFAIRWRGAGEAAYVIAVEGELDLFRAPQLREAFLDRLADGAREIVIDLSRTTFIDSTAAALLMTLPRLIGPGGTVSVVCDRPDVLRTLAITGVDRRVQVLAAPSAAPATTRAPHALARQPPR